MQKELCDVTHLSLQTRPELQDPEEFRVSPDVLNKYLLEQILMLEIIGWLVHL